MSSRRIEDAFGWLRGEYLEVPGLALAPPQVATRLNLDVVTAEVVLQALQDSRFLKRTPDGRFIRPHCSVVSRRFLETSTWRPTTRERSTKRRQARW